VIFLVSVAPSSLLAEENEVAKKWNDFFVGNWSRATTVTLDEETTKSKSDWNCKSVGGAITAEGGTGEGGKYIVMMAWDGFHDCLHEFGKNTEGDSWQIHFDPSDAQVLKGEATASLGDGRKGEGTCVIKRTGPNSYTAVFEAKLDDGSKFVVKDVNERKQRPPQNSQHLEAMAYFIGSWKAESENGATTTWTFKWGRNKNFIENAIVAKNPEGKIKWTDDGMLCWDKNAHLIINRLISGAGEPENFYWRQENPEAWVTWRTGAKNEMPVVLIDKNTWRIGTGTDRQEFKRVQN
jgi:hypothetical protein